MLVPAGFDCGASPATVSQRTVESTPAITAAENNTGQCLVISTTLSLARWQGQAPQVGKMAREREPVFAAFPK
jgi:hypothetical protein